MSCEYWYDIYHRFSDDPTRFYEINVGNNSLRGQNIVEISLGNFKEDESATFNLQAQHFTISELIRKPDTREIIYRYQPLHGYVGKDYVEILAPTDINGNEVFETRVIEVQISVGN
jgi:hypothetical protein